MLSRFRVLVVMVVVAAIFVAAISVPGLGLARVAHAQSGISSIDSAIEYFDAGVETGGDLPVAIKEIILELITDAAFVGKDFALSLPGVKAEDVSFAVYGQIVSASTLCLSSANGGEDCFDIGAGKTVKVWAYVASPKGYIVEWAGARRWLAA